MLKLKHLFVLCLMCFGICVGHQAQAQDAPFWDLSNLFPDSYLEWRLNNFGLLNTIEATPEQTEALMEAKRKSLDAQLELRVSFIYHEDFKPEMAKILDTLERKVRSILTPQQYASLMDSGITYEPTEPAGHSILPAIEESIAPTPSDEAWDEEEEIAQYAESLMGEYSFLDITQAQATALAQKYMAMFKEDKLDEYDAYMTKAFQEVFTKEQYEAYEAYVAEQLAVYAIDSMEYSPEEEEEIAARMQEQQETLNKVQQRNEEIAAEKRANMTSFYKGMLTTLKSYFIPERRLIRAKLDMVIRPDDKQALEALRMEYAGLAIIYLDSMHEVYRSMDHLKEDVQDFIIESADVTEKEKLIMHELQPTVSIRNLVQTDRATFTKAKELAARYDKVLDAVAKEVDLLNISWLMQLALTMPEYDGNEEDVRKRIEAQILKEVYQTEKIEYWRNISFLLVEPGALDPTGLQSNRLAHELSVYPVPAKDFQTLDFELSTDGKVQVEVISQDGKLLKTLQDGPMQKGPQLLRVDVRDIPSTTYFYRITDAQGVSLVKAMRME